MRRAILLVSFGTSYEVARENSLERIYEDLCRTVRGIPVYQAYTSRIIIEKLFGKGISMRTVEEAVQELLEKGVQELYVVSTHMIPGMEYQKMLRSLEPYRTRFAKLRVTPSVLQEKADCVALVPVLRDILQFKREYEYILMGHGTEDAANIRYEQMNQALAEQGYTNVHIASVEAKPDLEDVVFALKAQNISGEIVVHPFMVVAGDHANNDMAGDADSYVTRLQELGWQTEAVVRGLGEYPEFRQIYVERLEKLLAES